jgi:putative endonuclease
VNDRRHALGAAGEDRAAEHLARAGYRIAARNVRAGGVEIDLVATRGDLVVFVEVKTRLTRAHPALESVDARKQARLARGAAAWLREHRPHARRARFDVIACEWEHGHGWRLAHLEGAFDAGP